MLAEFIDRIAALAKDANAVQIGVVPQLPGQVYVRHGDKLEWRDEPPLRRHHVIRSLQDFATFVIGEAEMTAPQVFHSHKEVVCVLDAGDGRERVTLPLAMTERFQTILAMRAGQKFTPPAAVNFLRFDLHGVGTDRLVAALRRVDFTRKGLGAFTTEHGKETLGRQVEAAVQNAEDVPDVIDADFPVYSNDGLKSVRVPIQIGVYLDVQADAVVLRPLADEIANAVENAQWQLHKLLVEAMGEIPVFAGEAQLG